MSKLQFTQGDTLAVPQITLEDADHNPIDLTGLTVAFRMVEYWTKALAVDDQPCLILQNQNLATRGQVRYDWQPVDIATAGLFLAWFIVDNGAGTEHFPVNGSLLIKINPAY
jgi:hypothetical protein